MPPTEADLRGVLLELRAIAKGAVPFVADSAADGAGDGAAAPASLRRVELPDPEGDDFDDAHAADPDDAMDGGSGVANGGGNGVANGGAHGTPPPLLSVQAFAGRAALPPTLLTRLATALRRLGELLAPTEATKNLLQLLRVVRIVLSDRGPSHAMQALRQLQHFSRRTVMLRGGDRQKRLPRAMLVFKLAMRHAHPAAPVELRHPQRVDRVVPIAEHLVGVRGVTIQGRRRRVANVLAVLSPELGHRRGAHELVGNAPVARDQPTVARAPKRRAEGEVEPALLGEGERAAAAVA